jgi:dipeptidyl aminopeptidase/acylaminoacyl peptidase
MAGSSAMMGARPRRRQAGPPVWRFASWPVWGATMLLAAGCAASGGPSPTSASAPTIAASSSFRPSIATSPLPSAVASPISLPSAGRILFVIEADSGNHPAYLDKNGLHEIPTVPDPTLAKASWASADSIIFDSERDVRRHIFRMGLDGGDVVELTSGDDIQERPAISPDGSTIAYADFVDAFLGADLGLHLANADGTNPRALTKPGKPGANGGDTSPAFSPDGHWVAFQRAVDFDAGKGGIFLIRTDGSGLRRLTDDTLGAGYPRWSPDGKRILFSQRVEATTFAPGPLWVVDVAGGKPTPLTDPTDPGISFGGDWSPDGAQIVFDYFVPGSGQPELRVVNADGTHPSTLLIGGGETPDWGP